LFIEAGAKDGRGGEGTNYAGIVICHYLFAFFRGDFGVVRENTQECSDTIHNIHGTAEDQGVILFCVDILEAVLDIVDCFVEIGFKGMNLDSISDVGSGGGHLNDVPVIDAHELGERLDKFRHWLTVMFGSEWELASSRTNQANHRSLARPLVKL
jgi:hypothetical protein